MLREFRYLEDVALRYGVDAVQVVTRSSLDFVNGLTPHQVTELAQAYDEIRRREEMIAVLGEFQIFKFLFFVTHIANAICDALNLVLIVWITFNAILMLLPFVFMALPFMTAILYG